MALSSISGESRFRGAPGHGNSLAMAAMGGFGGEQEAAEHLFTVVGVAAAGKAAQVTPQVLEPAFPPGWWCAADVASGLGKRRRPAPAPTRPGTSRPSPVPPTASVHRNAAPTLVLGLRSPHPRSTRTPGEISAAAPTEIVASALPGCETNAPGIADAAQRDRPLKLGQ